MQAKSATLLPGTLLVTYSGVFLFLSTSLNLFHSVLQLIQITNIGLLKLHMFTKLQNYITHVSNFRYRVCKNPQKQHIAYSEEGKFDFLM